MTGSRANHLAVLALVAAGALAYAGTFSAPLQLDDFGSITDNPTILKLSDLGAVLSPPRESGITVNGRPLLNLSFAINYAISGYDVWSYHLVNLLIHLAAALALFGIVRRSIADRAGTAIALGSALLWMLHPLQTEAVTYLVQRAESLVSLFYLLTIYCFVRSLVGASLVGARVVPGVASPFDKLRVPSLSRDGAPTGVVSSGRWTALSVAACFAGMATKEVMVSAPLIVLLFDRTFVAGSFKEALRQRGRYYAALASSWALLGWLVFHASGRGGTAGSTDYIQWWQYLFTQCRAIVLYLRLIVWPHPLVFDYGMGFDRSLGPVAVQATLLVALAGATLYSLKRFPVAGFFGAFFFAVLAPSSSIVPVATQTMAEHRVYLALAAVAVPLAVLLYRRIGLPSLGITAATALLLGVLTVVRNQDYRSGLSLWADTVAKYPSSARAQNNYGASLMQEGKLEEAIPYYREAIRIRPDYLRARGNLAQTLVRTGDAAGAFEQYTEIIRIHPDFEGHVAYARMLEQGGNRRDAIAHLREAVRLKPDASEALTTLGNLLFRENQVAEAIVQYRAAIAAQPRDAAAQSNLGTALAFSGQLEEGASAHERALQLNPALVGARVGLALIRSQQNRIPEAIDLLERVVAENPDHALAKSTLAALKARQP